MKILLNGFELPKSAEGEQTVGEVLTELKQEIHRSGKVVTQVRMDNRPVPIGWQARQRMATPVRMISQLDLMIQDPDHLRKSTLSDVQDLISRMLTELAPLARKFRLGDEVAANNELAACLENLKLMLNGLELCARSGTAPTHLLTRQNLNRAAERMIPVLDRIYKAQSIADYIAVADELQYELPTHLSDWSDLITKMDMHQVATQTVES